MPPVACLLTTPPPCSDPQHASLPLETPGLPHWPIQLLHLGLWQGSASRVCLSGGRSRLHCGPMRARCICSALAGALTRPGGSRPTAMHTWA